MRSVLLLLVFLVVCPVSAFQIVEFCPDPYLPQDRDEFIVLDGSGSLDGLTISDGEGGFRFPAGARSNGRVVVARDGSAYSTTHGTPPDFEWEDSGTLVPDVVRNGRFQLSNTGDQLELRISGTLVQRVEWPSMVQPREGQVHFLDGSGWNPRILMLGQSRFEPAYFTGVCGIAFVAPDCSREVFLQAVRGAEREILVSVYEFSSPVMADSLLKARGRGVSVGVILEGGPVGGISKEEEAVVSMLTGGGIPVLFMQGTATTHSPYRFLHSKFLVIDREDVLVTSENFKEHGFPQEGISGNRGWGVLLENPDLAGYFASVYHHDAGGGWAVQAQGKGGADEIPSSNTYSPEFRPLEFENATVVPVIAPDTSSLVCAYLGNAEKSVDIEMAYITNESPGVLNPFLSSAINASRRGVQVRVLLDNYYYNVEGEEDNDEMAAVINEIARNEGIALEARCANLGPGSVEKIHNKGVIVDRERVMVSSINWNSNSPAFNREAAVIVDHPEVGAYFTAAFEKDWDSGVKVNPGNGVDYWKIAAACAVIALLLLFFRKKR